MSNSNSPTIDDVISYIDFDEFDFEIDVGDSNSEGFQQTAHFQEEHAGANGVRIQAAGPTVVQQGFQETESGAVNRMGIQETGSGAASMSGVGGFQQTGVLIQRSDSNFFPDPPARRRIIVGVTGTPGAKDISSLVNDLLPVAEVCLVCTKDSLMFFTRSSIDKQVRLLTDDDETRTWADERKMLHETLSSWAEQIYVVPASSDVLTKVSLGRSDDLLTRTIRSFTGQVFLVADMDPGSYRNGSTTKCAQELLYQGYTVKYPLMPPSNQTWTMGPMSDVTEWVMFHTNVYRAKW